MKVSGRDRNVKVKKVSFSNNVDEPVLENTHLLTHIFVDIILSLTISIYYGPSHLRVVVESVG